MRGRTMKWGAILGTIMLLVGTAWLMVARYGIHDTTQGDGPWDLEVWAFALAVAVMACGCCCCCSCVLLLVCSKEVPESSSFISATSGSHSSDITEPVTPRSALKGSRPHGARGSPSMLSPGTRQVRIVTPNTMQKLNAAKSARLAIPPVGAPRTVAANVAKPNAASSGPAGTPAEATLAAVRPEAPAMTRAAALEAAMQIPVLSTPGRTSTPLRAPGAGPGFGLGPPPSAFPPESPDPAFSITSPTSVHHIHIHIGNPEPVAGQTVVVATTPNASSPAADRIPAPQLSALGHPPARTASPYRAHHPRGNTATPPSDQHHRYVPPTRTSPSPPRRLFRRTRVANHSPVRAHANTVGLPVPLETLPSALRGQTPPTRPSPRPPIRTPVPARVQAPTMSLSPYRVV